MSENNTSKKTVTQKITNVIKSVVNVLDGNKRRLGILGGFMTVIFSPHTLVYQIGQYMVTVSGSADLIQNYKSIPSGLSDKLKILSRTNIKEKN